MAKLRKTKATQQERIASLERVLVKAFTAITKLGEKVNKLEQEIYKDQDKPDEENQLNQ